MSWFDWNLIEKHADILRFFKKMIAFRKHHAILRRGSFFKGQINQRGLADITWHGCRLNAPGWHDSGSRALAFTLGGFPEEDREDIDIHVMLNMEWEDLSFDVPLLADRKWLKIVDTSQPSPHDIIEPRQAIEHPGQLCLVGNRSIVILVSLPS